MKPIRIGRWWIEYHRRAIHITREPKQDPKPDPNCLDCGGRGGHGWVDHNDNADWEDCHCVDQIRGWRLPLWRKAEPEAWPF